MSRKATWTVMVYIAGDNNLSAAGDNDLLEMRRVGSSAAVNVIAQFDNAGDHGTRRFHIQRDGRGERIESLPETDSGSPDVLIDFIGWVAVEYPAERYALILWNHGGGWAPTEMDRVARSVEAVDYSEHEVTERAASPLRKVFFRPSLEQIFRRPGPAERAICSDDGSGHSLDTIELRRVMTRAVENLGQKIDLLGMDACLMNNFEVAYELRDHVRFLVASEEDEPEDGWPYDRILAALSADPAMDTADLARSIVDNYIAYYAERRHWGNVTQSALDLSRVADVAEILDTLASAMIEHMPNAAAEIWSAQRHAAHFANNTLWDVSHFCRELETRTVAKPVGEAAAEIRSALAPGPNRPIVAEGHRGYEVTYCGGVNLYLVPPLTPISRYYRELAYAVNHRWLDMLEAYHAARV